jgi:hypothetical protein
MALGGLHQVKAAVKHGQGLAAVLQVLQLSDGDEGGVHAKLLRRRAYLVDEEVG